MEMENKNKLEVRSVVLPRSNKSYCTEIKRSFLFK